jgi:GTP-binding protein
MFERIFLFNQGKRLMRSAKKIMNGRIIRLPAKSTSSGATRWNPAHLLRPPPVSLRPDKKMSKRKMEMDDDQENEKARPCSSDEIDKLELLHFTPHQLQSADKFFTNATVEWKILHTINEIDPKIDAMVQIKKRGRSKPHILTSSPSVSTSTFSSSPSSQSPSQSSVNWGDLARAFIPEVAVLGRSNVGKSSLLNALLGSQRKVLRVSKTPGTTQEVHYLDLIGPTRRIRLVDMPGYGYAETSSVTIEHMSNLLRTYLLSRLTNNPTITLRLLLLLVDIRRGLDKKDRDILQICTTHTTSSLIVLTKSDKVSQTELDSAVRQVEDEISKDWALTAYPRVLVTSALTNFGISQLRAVILDACAVPWKQTAPPPRLPGYTF